MKNIFLMLVLVLAVGVSGCSRKKVEVTAADPAPVSASAQESTETEVSTYDFVYADDMYAQELADRIKDRIFFGLDSSTLDAKAMEALNIQIAWLKANPTKMITLEGHCDERGTREYNLGLGERRANAVKRYMVAKGIAPSRIKTISYGKERPAILGNDEAAWAQNRRTVTVVR